MSEPFHATDKPKKTKGRKIIDIAIGLVILIVCVVLIQSFLAQLSLKHEVNEAKTITNQVVQDIQNKNGKHARSLGSKVFQSQNTAANLTAQFEAASKLTASSPVVDRQIVTNDKTGQAVGVIYKFPKSSFYIKVTVSKLKGEDKFHVIDLRADPSEKPLLDSVVK